MFTGPVSSYLILTFLAVDYCLLCGMCLTFVFDIFANVTELFRCNGEMEESRKAFDEVCEPLFVVIRAINLGTKMKCTGVV